MPAQKHQANATGDEAPPRRVVVSLGDPAGIGPEIVVKALVTQGLGTKWGNAQFVLVGDEPSLALAAARAGIAPFWRVTDQSLELGRAWMGMSGTAGAGAAGEGPWDAARAAVATGSIGAGSSKSRSLWQRDVVLVPLEWDMGGGMEGEAVMGERAAGKVGNATQCTLGSPVPPDLRIAGPTAWSGRVSFEAVDLAVAVAKAEHEAGCGHCAIVTAPISKTAWRMARDAAESQAVGLRMGPEPYGFPGHTELLAQRFNAPESGMMFFGPSLRVALATVHVPLGSVVGVLRHDPECVLRAIRLTQKGCAMAGVERPRIAVCGVNPHAGEGGLLGDEDDHLVGPQVLLARHEGIDAHGPLPADTLFARALLKDGKRVKDEGFDAVVAMYHDQGLIPCKLVDGYRAVNVTVGLPGGIVRTSPAHGTAYDIAGKNIANAESMVEAVGLGMSIGM